MNHTLEIYDDPNAPNDPQPMPLRVKIRDNITGTEFTIQAVPGGIRVSVDAVITIRPDGSNAINLTQTSF
jgi:hypothetical protein